MVWPGLHAATVRKGFDTFFRDRYNEIPYCSLVVIGEVAPGSVDQGKGNGRNAKSTLAHLDAFPAIKMATYKGKKICAELQNNDEGDRGYIGSKNVDQN